jgi:hypothetical protein
MPLRLAQTLGIIPYAEPSFQHSQNEAEAWFLAQMSSIAFPAAAAALAVGIFAVDTITDLDIAAAVLYVVVVLMSVRFLGRPGVILVCLGCMALTVLSFFLTSA